jgi:hypothetical protein
LGSRDPPFQQDQPCDLAPGRRVEADEEKTAMKSNSSQSDGKNNNHDPTFKELEGRSGAAQTDLRDREFEPAPKAPSDSRGGRQ